MAVALGCIKSSSLLPVEATLRQSLTPIAILGYGDVYVWIMEHNTSPVGVFMPL